MTVPVSELARHHIPLLKQHFDQLPAQDLRLRFGVPRAPEAVHDYVESIDFERDAVFGAFSDDLGLVGVVHLARLDQAAELGLSVLPQLRGRGFGTALFGRALTRARNLRIAKLFMHCLAENEAMMHIAQKAGMRVVLDHPEADACIEVPPGNLLTLGQEMLEQQMALVDWVLKLQAEQFRWLAGGIVPPPTPREFVAQRPELRLIEGGKTRRRERRYG